MKKKYWQQGDVLMFPAELPKEAKRLETNVLQEGEHTGHAHRLQFRHDDKAIGSGSGVFQMPGTLEKFFCLKEPTLLKHEEHKEILVPAGTYRVGIVQEYDHFAEEARQVQD